VLELTGDGLGLLVRAGYGLPEGVVGGVIDTRRDQLPGYALDHPGPVVVEDFRKETRFDPTPVQRDLGVVSALAVQIRAAGRQVGGIAVHSRVVQEFSAEDGHFLQALANVIGAAIERARHEEEVRDSEARFRELADTAPALMWMTDAEGDVTFVNEGWLRFTGRELSEDLGDTFGMSSHPDDRDDLLERWRDAFARRTEFRFEYRLMHRSGEYRWVLEVGIPRFSGGEFVGYVGTAIDIHERKTMESQLREVYEREHTIAETLQRSLLPERLPRIEGLEIAARYLPAGQGAAIGGDWYDALERPDGRVALVVGDVVGHGLRAAAIMGQLRNAFRAYGLAENSPAEVMAKVNRLVMTGEDEVMATALYLVLERETGEVHYSSAGHPPPLVLSDSGASFLEGARSVPIGAVDPGVFREASATLPTDASLLLYTDGLVERRDEPLERRLDALAEAADRAPGGLEGLCDAVLAGVIGHSMPGDDVALLAVRPRPVASESVRFTLPAEPESLPGLRRRLARFLHAAGADDAETYEITLTVCEAAGNAIEHAYGPGDATFDVEARLDARELVATVSDRGHWRERRGAHRGRGLNIIEGLMDKVEVSTEQEGTVVRMSRRLGASRAA
jgi:PAS domain S-box-containing protein